MKRRTDDFRVLQLLAKASAVMLELMVAGGRWLVAGGRRWLAPGSLFPCEAMLYLKILWLPGQSGVLERTMRFGRTVTDISRVQG